MHLARFMSDLQPLQHMTKGSGQAEVLAAPDLDLDSRSLDRYPGSMPYSGWREAAAVLKAHVGPRTALQSRLAKAAGVPLPQTVPRLVADARLQLAISRDLGLHRLPRFRGVRGVTTTESQAARIRELQEQGKAPLTIPADTHEAEAWIQHLALNRRLESITRLQLDAGDIVQVSTGVVAEVASIREDGRINFKGGRGSGAWPDLLRVRCRRDDVSARGEQWRARARNAAARRAESHEWSLQKAHELSEYLTQEWVTEDEIVQLELCVGRATDEKPIQEFLAGKPHILASLLGGTERYCIPKQRLGKHYVPDFLICHADSSGAHWTLVELETPVSTITLKRGDDLERHARMGVSQIHQWRRWLETNLATARISKREDGLGLVDMPTSPRGLVLVGRRELMGLGNERVRRTFALEQRVDIHTYDWLVEVLRASRRIGGPPGANPHLIHEGNDSAAPLPGSDLLA